jgi:hypothetical protein
MVDGLAITLIVAGLLVAAFSGLLALLNRPPQWAQLIGLAVVEALLLVQAAIATGRMVVGDRPDQLATFIGYLLTAVLIPILAAMLGWSERTRWGSVVIAAGGAVVAIMTVRLQQVWHG